MKRPLLISGFMGAGKSTVGRRVAASTGTDFVDLDRRVEAEAGKPVARIFAEDGEEAFRALERRCLGAILAAARPEVVALGGGALLRREARLAAIDGGVVATLTARPETVVRRTSSRGSRPLLDVPDPGERVAALLEQRGPAYAECHARVATDERDPANVAEELAALWRRDPLGVAAGDRSYAVDVGEGIGPSRLHAERPPAPVTLVVSDDHVAPLHAGPAMQALEGSATKPHMITFPAGEEHKTAATLETLWQRALELGADRKALFVGLGGGVVTDVAGFFAATWMRGVRWVSVPTTLLGMVDAAVGGKTAIDLPGAKNSVGAFWQPGAVICDVAYLATEPERGYVSALAEVVKTAIIGDPELFEELEREAQAARSRSAPLLAEIVRRCIRVKARVVSADEREGGVRATLNLGHTIGHAIEAHGGYGHLRHGEAVSLGLVAALRIGQRLGRTPAELAERTTALLDAVGLPTDLSSVPLADAVDLVAHDKKRQGDDIKLIVAEALGDVRVTSMPLAALREHALATATR